MGLRTDAQDGLPSRDGGYFTHLASTDSTYLVSADLTHLAKPRRVFPTRNGAIRDPTGPRAGLLVEGFALEHPTPDHGAHRGRRERDDDQHPERELRAAGAVFENASKALEPFANLTVVDGRLVTGQNQNAGVETAQMMLRAAGGQPAAKGLATA